MKNIVKKITIYSMVGMMQIGFGASVIEASPLYNDGSQRFVQLDNRNHDYERQREHNERKREHDRRQREENERHEREMRRHHHESEREWRERQERENQRHRNAINEIAAFLIGIAIGSSSN
jgi:membrane protein involved in colicin uptake